MRHAVATALLALLILVVWWCSADRKPPLQAEEVVREYPQDEAAIGTPGPEDTPAEPGAEAQVALVEKTSLSGTEVDGALSLIDGRFIPDLRALRMFNYFLSTEGELSPEEIRALVEREARARVPADQVSAVMGLFDDYLRYRRDAAELAERSSADSYFEELKALQSEIFGADAEALFGRENSMAAYAIARKAIATDSDLTATEKNAKLADLDATLPEPLREVRAKMHRHTAVSNVVEQMRRDGLSEEEVFEYRADEFGEEAAERLTELDSRRAEWSRRLADYRARRDEILARNLAAGVEEAALEELRQEHFEGPEVRRVRALDRTEGSEAQ